MLVVAAHILTGKGERSKETSTSYIDECERVRGDERQKGMRQMQIPRR